MINVLLDITRIDGSVHLGTLIMICLFMWLQRMLIAFEFGLLILPTCKFKLKTILDSNSNDIKLSKYKNVYVTH